MKETIGKTFNKPVRIDERGLPVGEQVFYTLSRADFILLTKVWSLLILWAQFTLAILLTRILDISSKAISTHMLVVETWQQWFLGIMAIVTIALFILGIKLNPKRKIIKGIEKYFEQYD